MSKIEPQIVSSINIIRAVYKLIIECIKFGVTTKDEFNNGDISFNNLIKIAFKTQDFKVIHGKRNLSIAFEDKDLSMHSRYINKEVQKIYKDFSHEIENIKPNISIERPREKLDIKYLYSRLDKFIV